MHFNVLKLEKRLKKLELLLNSTNDINKKIELSRDIRSLRIMINYVSGCEYKNPEEVKIFDDSLIDKNEELASFLNVYGWDIYKSMYFYSSGFRLPWRIIKDRKIDDKEYIELLELFLNTYEPTNDVLYLAITPNYMTKGYGVINQIVTISKFKKEDYKSRIKTLIKLRR